MAMSSGKHTTPVDGRGVTASETSPAAQDIASKPQKMTSRTTTNGPESKTTIPLQYSTPPTGKNGSHRMNTINNSAGDGHGSDNHTMQQAPTQSMFNSLYDDSDGSDGRYVFSFYVLISKPSIDLLAFQYCLPKQTAE